MLHSGSAADLCKSAMLHVERKLQEQQLARDAHLLLQIHDELLWEVRNAQLANVRGESSCLNQRHTMGIEGLIYQGCCLDFSCGVNGLPVC
jgi:hypothetical protein